MAVLWTQGSRCKVFQGHTHGMCASTSLCIELARVTVQYAENPSVAAQVTGSAVCSMMTIELP